MIKIIDKIISKAPIKIVDARLTISNLKEKCPMVYDNYVNDGSIFKVLKVNEDIKVKEQELKVKLSVEVEEVAIKPPKEKVEVEVKEEKIEPPVVEKEVKEKFS